MKSEENNEKLKQIAIKILEQSNVPKENEYGFSILIILMVISIILTCIRLLQECHKKNIPDTINSNNKYEIYGEQIKSLSLKKGWFTKMRIKKILRKEMSPEEYKEYATSIMNAILNKGEFLNNDEIKTLVDAANV